MSALESARRKDFFELDEDHIKKLGIKCILAKEAKMNLTAISSLESARRKLWKNDS